MPRDGSQIYSPPPGTAAVSGASISSSAFNQLVADLAADLNTPRPISAGGTGATSAATALVALGGVAANDRLIPWDAGDIKPTARTTATAGWLLCYGQAISRTTYAALFAAIGTTHGTGDGSTTFNVPDYRGRVLAGRDNMGGTSADRLTGLSGGIDGDTLGAVGGAETHTLTVAQMPAHQHTFTGNALPGHSHQVGASYIGSGTSNTGGYINPTGTGAVTTAVSAGTPSGTISSAGGGGAHPNVQPTAIVNFVIKT